MSGRILIVAEGFSRAKRFEEELVAASFEVAIATSAQDCIAACAQGAVDVVLLDTVSPGSRAIELCRTLKGSAGAADLAILAVTADDAPLQRLKALDAGATECLRVPYDDGSLIARLRNLVRSRRLADQGAGLRQGTSASRETPVRVIILDPDERSRLRLAAILAGEFQVASFSEPGPGIIQVAQGQHDLAVVSLEWETFDGFRLCRQIRLVDPTGLMPVILVTEGTDLEFAADGRERVRRLDRSAGRQERGARSSAPRCEGSRACCSAEGLRGSFEPRLVTPASTSPGPPRRVKRPRLCDKAPIYLAKALMNRAVRSACIGLTVL